MSAPPQKKTSFKNIVSGSFLRLPPPLLVYVLEGVERFRFQICKNILIPAQLCVKFSQNIDWKIIAIISLQMRNLGFKIFLKSGFLDGNHV